MMQDTVLDVCTARLLATELRCQTPKHEDLHQSARSLRDRFVFEGNELRDEGLASSAEADRGGRLKAR